MSTNILQTIAAHKAHEVMLAKQQKPLQALQELISTLPAPRDFLTAITTKLAANKMAVIAEIKKASPSKGIIRNNFDPIAIAKSYAAAGATCLSILTDQKFFQGSDLYLQQVREIVELPILRKDFIIDVYQIYETRSIGADCILLIAALLTDAQLKEYSELAQQLGLTVLIEVHDGVELKRVLPLSTRLIGVNNRDLRTFHTDINVSLTLQSILPNDRILVTESGIHKPQDVAIMNNKGIKVFLIGETFMRADDPGAKLKELFSIHI